MWEALSTKHKDELLSTAFNDELKAALSAAVPPKEITTPNEKAAVAEADAQRASELINTEIQVLEITPWANGTASESKHSMSFYLSASQAVEILTEKLKSIGWDKAVVMAAMADNEAALHAELETLAEALPFSQITKAMRNAEKIASHEGQKRFIEKLPAVAQNKNAQQIGFFKAELPVRQNIKVSAAVASDKSPGTMLSAFINKREQRLTDIKAEVAAMASAAGSIAYLASLTGNLADQLKSSKIPNEQASMCVLFAFGGTAQQVEELQEGLGI